MGDDARKAMIDKGAGRRILVNQLLQVSFASRRPPALIAPRPGAKILVDLS